MLLGRGSRFAAVACLASLAGAVAAPRAFAQREKGGATQGDSSRSELRAPRNERASGVIVKVEKVTKEVKDKSSDRRGDDSPKSGKPTLRLSINMNAVWRDWARDQARFRDKGPAKKDAKEGDNSIAT